MKRTFLLTVILALAFLATETVYGQDYVAPPVTISKEKIKMDGKVFFSHVVLEKQTLYSISKAYGVTVDQIFEANPALKETGLKKNSIILIPANDERTDREIRKDEERQERKEARKSREKEKQNYIIHTVRWYEDLNVISEKYGVPVQAIMEANGLKGRKLSNRQKLRIPLSSQETAVCSESDTMDIVQKADTIQSGPAVPDTSIPVEIKVQDRISAIILMPFNASGEKRNESCMDFYCGALLAARELGENGLEIDLSIYDTGNGTIPVTQSRLDMTDIVIGPLASGGLETVASKVSSGTFVISPLDHKAESLAEKYQNFIQVPSSGKSQLLDLAEWISGEMTGDDRIVVIHEKSLAGSENADMISGMLTDRGMKFSRFSYSILEGRNILDTLSALMTRTAMNRIIVASESEAFANDVIRNLNLLIHNKYRITLYSTSKIRSFETTDIDNLHNASLHVSTSYYIDYDRKDVQDFLLKYRAFFNTEPSAFSYQGYDIMKYFSGMISRYGDMWPSMLEREKADMLQSDFEFRKFPEGGYSNCGVRRIIYGTDYSIIEVK